MKRNIEFIDFIDRKLKAVILLILITISMYIGATLQLYVDVLANIALPEGYNIWYKILGFSFFGSTTEVKGTLSEKLYFAVIFLCIVAFIIFVINAVVIAKKLKEKNKIII